MRDGDVFRDIREHFDAPVNIFVQQVGTQLGIENARRQHCSVTIDRMGTAAINQIGNNQAISQAP